MEKYRHILLVANCAKEDEAALIQQTNNLIEPNYTSLSLAYFLPSIPPYYLQCPAALALEKQLKENAKTRLNQLADKIDCPIVNAFIKMGDLERELDGLATEQQVDLVIMAKSPQINLFQSFWQRLLHLHPRPRQKRLYIHSLLL